MTAFRARPLALALVAFLALGGTWSPAGATPETGVYLLQGADGAAHDLLLGFRESLKTFDIRAAKDAFDKKCPGNPPLCLLTECDAGLPLCREDHVLLFRGEKEFFGPVPTSALQRACQKGSAFCEGQGPQEALARLKEATASFRPRNGDYRPEQVQIAPVTNEPADRRRWAAISEDGDGKADGPTARFREFIVTTHVWGEPPYLADGRGGRVSLDPLISFSSNPEIALQFSGRQHPNSRFIVISVPRSEVDADCGNSLPRPGAVIDPTNCGVTEYIAENELPVVLWIEPDYFIGNFAVADSLK